MALKIMTIFNLLTNIVFQILPIHMSVVKLSLKETDTHSKGTVTNILFGNMCGIKSYNTGKLITYIFISNMCQYS